jgi:hypothetical protein
MKREQEHVEMRVAELVRASSSFRRLEEIWKELGCNEKPGYGAYAKQKAVMFARMAASCDEGLVRTGYGELVGGEVSVLEVIDRRRQAEKLIFDKA